MKSLFAFALILVSLSGFAQGRSNKENHAEHKSNMAGDIDNVRLDSIDSKYAEVEVRAIPFKGQLKVLFKHGQEYKYDEELTVKSRSGDVHQFKDFVTILNFLEHN